MNLILIEDSDFTDSGRVLLSGRRYRHIVDVHRAVPGDDLALGVLGGRIGIGTIVRMSADDVELEVRTDREPPAPLPLTVVLALPRPKVMRRVLYSLAVLGVKRIVLVNSARVEKSYWQTPFLHPDAMRMQFMLGLEQAGDTVLPEVMLRKLFRPFVEDELPSLIGGGRGLVAHPSAERNVPVNNDGPVALAVGPEGGFVPFETELFAGIGMHRISLGERIYNIETAIPALISTLF